MPRPPNNPWGFDAVIEFIGSDCFDVGAREPLSPPRSPHGTGTATDALSPKRKSLKSLGSFTNLFERLGISLDVPAPTVDLQKPTVNLPAFPAEGSSQGRELEVVPHNEILQDDGKGTVYHSQNVKNKSFVLELDTLEKEINTAEIATPNGPDDPVPSLIDDLGESGDAADSPEDDVDITNSEPDRKTVNDSLAGMSKKKRKRARKRAEKTRKAEELLQVSEERQQLIQIIERKVEKNAQESTKTDLFGKQQSRSNVGAKIRPATPVEVAPPSPVKSKKPTVTSILKRRPSVPVETSAVPINAKGPVITSILRRENPERPFDHKDSRPLAPRFSIPSELHVLKELQTPAPIRQIPVPLTAHPNALNNLNASLSTQYTTATGNVPYHQQLPPGFVTPSRGNKTIDPYPNVPSPHIPVSSNLHTPGPGPQPAVTPKAPQTLSARPREDRHFDFFTKLMEEFPEDKKWLVSPMRLTSDKSSPEGIHIFVDASNILIGFKESLKRTRNPSFDMSFDCLALLLERRRPVAKRVYAGSTRLTGPLASAEKFADLAGDVGYQMDIYEQVYKVREQTESQRFFKDVDRMGWAKATQIRTGSGSDSETGPPPTTPSAPKWVEQGVDESLHLKMCQSILDVEVPSTMVLATGDGAAAEYSDGFLAHVERALKKGWKVELVSWKQQTNGGYKNKKFRAKWGDAFRMIELDEYLQWMVDS